MRSITFTVLAQTSLKSPKKWQKEKGPKALIFCL